ncbi:MAG: hypothetical protein IJU76_15665 [Desulfovibrionaceae bacterium]|nr:hypothetical protein [Desulfovibrionaceae bacterium]
MEVGFYSNTNQGLVDVYGAAYLRSGYSTMNSNPSHVTPFGDSVRISPEAMALFMQSYSTLNDTKQVASDGWSDSAEKVHAPSVEEASGGAQEEKSKSGSSVEQQIHSLQAQLSNLLGQIKTSGEDTNLQSQIASVQAQLQTLQAQLS